ncbi:hypothetical protein C9374_002810 [Naegleria lovaniensis]|uniref:Uncharacterized protein n=1 Tax=Naegleria lovaniensis TaxID=51637 RepID=A0AA88KLZ5_NAELO|nr:uncharacterized protein C9374_002810 [Naegleria lovaniensis]KAG2386364.1 hypothetical protein C9374_002810 [Naegleria lovaniensis]
MKRSHDQIHPSPSSSHPQAKQPKTPQLSSAQQRLLRDWKEIQSCAKTLDTIWAQPLENDLYTWHGTLLAHPQSDYAGIILRLKMTFPMDYPHNPCNIELLNMLHHSHVHNGHICLDMLKTHHSTERYSGWSSSYTVLSILLQLQSFLFEEEKDQVFHIEQDVWASRKFKMLPDHDPENGKIWPCAPHWDVNAILRGKCAVPKNSVTAMTVDTFGKNRELPLVATSSSSSNQNAGPLVLDLPQELLIHIFDYLTTIELKTLEKVCQAFRKLVNCRQLSTARELVCFYSKLSFHEDTLGIGLNIRPIKNGKYDLSTSLDIIGWKSFHQDGVRTGVWNNEFNFWLPLYINKYHANIQLFKDSVLTIQKQCPGFLNDKAALTGDNFPFLAMDVLCKLMNAMIVEIMKGYSHASIKALQGYCHFHRWMIYLAQTYPQQLAILESVEKFLNEKSARLKTSCPDLGVFLPRLSVLGPNGITWNSIKKVVIDEVTTRNAFWVTLKFPDLANVQDGNDTARVRLSWESNKVSCGLIMFHVFFLRSLVEKHGRECSLEMLGRMYDVNFGCPEGNFEHVLQKEIFKILKISRLSEFFEYIGLAELDSNSKIAAYLRQCLKKAYDVGYIQQVQNQHQQHHHHHYREHYREDRYSSGSRGRHNYY